MLDLGGGTYAPPQGDARAVPAATATLTVAIYDDHALARAGLAALLGREGIAVRHSTSVETELVLGALPHPTADVALVAAAGGGGELARRLSQDQEQTVLLMVDSPCDADALMAMLVTGAAGAVCRSCSGERVIAAIRTVARGDGVPECRHRAVAPANVEEPQLSERERRIAIELARGLRTEDIAAELCISRHTVRTHVRNIKRKLGARTAAHAVALAIAGGAVPASAPGPSGRVEGAAAAPSGRVEGAAAPETWR